MEICLCLSDDLGNSGILSGISSGSELDSSKSENLSVGTG